MSEGPIRNQPAGMSRRTRVRDWRALWRTIQERGWRGTVVRYAGHVAALTLVLIGIVAARAGWLALPLEELRRAPLSALAAGTTPTPLSAIGVDLLPPFSGGGLNRSMLQRRTEGHTEVPSRPRLEIIQYAVQQGDSLFGIAERFGLKPETLLWGNYDVLQDDPHSLQPGQELSVLPVDGTSYTWHAGDGLSGVSSFFGVTPEEIIDWPGNGLDPDMDLENPAIEVGKVLVIPGGTREVTSLFKPRITRSNPGVARILGAGACGAIYDGAVGTGSFGWPTPLHYLSGYDYNPGLGHPAIDIAGDTGHSVAASDSGVIVYAGWNDYGYGLTVVVDHGNDWQTLYAHLSQVNVSCGQSVFQGNLVGLMGCTGSCTGSHLHFEVRYGDGFVNPWDVLP
jgi:murein DD-endopeptidase MepM/ murein hydrolase activator NlpD